MMHLHVVFFPNTSKTEADAPRQANTPSATLDTEEALRNNEKTNNPRASPASRNVNRYSMPSSILPGFYPAVFILAYRQDAPPLGPNRYIS